LNGASPAASGSGGNTASPRTNQPNRQQTIPGAGSYSVLHMDIEASPPQQTSDMVASTGGRGVLHKVPAPKGSSTQFPNVSDGIFHHSTYSQTGSDLTN
jgi:hypothetical protein